ncbi:MAG: hypothetical protein IKT35_04385 [Clostridia bacterium]|nr:hypothetical protein [Clostridia bacterium]
MFKKILLVTLCLVMALTFVACKGENGLIDHELIGTWEYNLNHDTKYSFNEDGTGALDVVQTNNDKTENKTYGYTFKINGNQVSIDFEANIVQDCTYTFTVEGDKLTFVGGEGTDKGTYELSRAK